MKRFLLILVAVVLVVVIAGGLFLYRSLDTILAAAIEHYGSEALGTSVRVDSVELELQSGRGTIRGLRVANPSGFSSGDAFALDEISLALDLDSLGGSPVTVDELVIGAPVLAYEMDDRGRNNLSTLADQAAGGAESEGSNGEAASGEEPRIRIRKLVFREGQVSASAVGKKVEVPLASFTMSQLGGSAGATPAQIGQAVATELAKRTTSSVAREELDKRVGGKLSEEVDKAKTKLFDKLRGGD